MLPSFDISTFLPGGLDLFGGFGTFGAAGLGNLMVLALCGLFGLTLLRLLAAALVTGMTGSRMVGDVAGTCVMFLVGYWAATQVMAPKVMRFVTEMFDPVVSALSSLPY